MSASLPPSDAPTELPIDRQLWPSDPTATGPLVRERVLSQMLDEIFPEPDEPPPGAFETLKRNVLPPLPEPPTPAGVQVLTETRVAGPAVVYAPHLTATVEDEPTEEREPEPPELPESALQTLPPAPEASGPRVLPTLPPPAPVDTPPPGPDRSTFHPDVRLLLALEGIERHLGSLAQSHAKVAESTANGTKHKAQLVAELQRILGEQLGAVLKQSGHLGGAGREVCSVVLPFLGVDRRKAEAVMSALGALASLAGAVVTLGSMVWLALGAP